MAQAALELILDPVEPRLVESHEERFVDTRPEVVVDAPANVEDFRCSKRYAYGQNYEKFCTLYEMVADTILPGEMESLIKGAYKRREKELHAQLVDVYSTQEQHAALQERIFDDISATSGTPAAISGISRYLVPNIVLFVVICA